jgi:hypothetical protein
MSAGEVTTLLAETKQVIGGKPWGIGILGFVPEELREEQLSAAIAFSPPFAVIAGGRPSQVRDLEARGIKTYLHVPSPELLRAFLKSGVRRVIFEGRECGGHIGPRTSFVLWDQMIEILLEHFEKPSNEQCEDYFCWWNTSFRDLLFKRWDKVSANWQRLKNKPCYSLLLEMRRR